MNLFNFKKKLDSRLLLHVCCAPCALSPVPEFAASGVAFDAFFYNPNIFDACEHDRRLAEVKKIAEIFEFALHIQTDEYSKFVEYVAGLESEPEGGARCTKCFELRLSAAFDFAESGGYRYVATTLSTSPHKNVKTINAIGEEISARHGGRVGLVEFDFKKGDGYKKSVDRCRQYSIYRQNYCGCHFSKR